MDLRWGVPAKDTHGETANSWECCRCGEDLSIGRIAAQRGHDLSMQESGRGVKGPPHEAVAAQGIIVQHRQAEHVLRGWNAQVLRGRGAVVPIPMA